MDPEELTAAFARRVSQVAKERGLTVNRLADFAGVSRGYLSEVLRGKKAPSLTVVAKIAGALEIEVWELFAPDRVIRRVAAASRGRR